jgi:hypothetical protein
VQPTHDDLRQLVANNPGQGTFEEYVRVLDTITQRAPAKLLIFGVGRDSALWYRANQGGRTVFVEHEPDWIAATRAQLPQAEIVGVHYWTRRWQWPLLLEARALLFLRGLPAHVRDEQWDVIFVDSPQGGKWSRPGRMQSLYTASRLAQRSSVARTRGHSAEAVDLLAHDCDRRVEQVYCDRYLPAAALVDVTRTLRHYRIAG